LIDDLCCCGLDIHQSCSCSDSDKTDKIVKEYYDRIWNDQKATERKQASPSEASKALLEELKPTKGMKVLDIGSGNGETILTIAERVGPTGKAVGIDFSPNGVALAKQKAKERRLEDVAGFYVANALELPFADCSFDAVISECVICLVENKEKAIEEIVRVLKPKGRVIMHDVVSWKPLPKVIRSNKKLYCSCIGGAASLEEYVEIMKCAGLTNIEAVNLTEVAKRMLNVSILDVALELKDDKDFQEMVNFVRKGGIGYALLIGTKTP